MFTINIPSSLTVEVTEVEWLLKHDASFEEIQEYIHFLQCDEELKSVLWLLTWAEYKPQKVISK